MSKLSIRKLCLVKVYFAIGVTFTFVPLAAECLLSQELIAQPGLSRLSENILSRDLLEVWAARSYYYSHVRRLL